MAIAWAIGAGMGLASLAGFRAFLPLAVFIFMARLGLVWGFQVEDTPFDFLMSNVAVAIVLSLAVLEVISTRSAALAAAERILRRPLAVVAGALLFAAALAGELPGWLYLFGVPAGLLIAFLGSYVYGGLTLLGQGRDPGPALDISVLFLSALTILLPPAGYALGLAIAWLSLRVRRLKKQKYKGLRVLA